MKVLNDTPPLQNTPPNDEIIPIDIAKDLVDSTLDQAKEIIGNELAKSIRDQNEMTVINKEPDNLKQDKMETKEVKVQKEDIKKNNDLNKSVNQKSAAVEEDMSEETVSESLILQEQSFQAMSELKKDIKSTEENKESKLHETKQIDGNGDDKAMKREVAAPEPNIAAVPATVPAAAVPVVVPATVPAAAAPSTVSAAAVPATVPAAVPATNPAAVPATVPSGVLATVPSAVPANVPATVSSGVPAAVSASVPTVPAPAPAPTPANVSAAVNEDPSPVPAMVPAADPSLVPAAVLAASGAVPETDISLTLTVDLSEKGGSKENLALPGTPFSSTPTWRQGCKNVERVQTIPKKYLSITPATVL